MADNQKPSSSDLNVNEKQGIRSSTDTLSSYREIRNETKPSKVIHFRNIQADVTKVWFFFLWILTYFVLGRNDETSGRFWTDWLYSFDEK